MMDMSEFKDLFASEAQEHLDTLVAKLLELEQTPHDQEAVEALFRAAHSLKGIAATMGYQEVARVAHAFEDVLDLLRHRDQPVPSSLVDHLLTAVDTLKGLLEDALAETSPRVVIEEWIAQFKENADTLINTHHLSTPAPHRLGSTPSVAKAMPTDGAVLPQTIRIHTRHLDTLLNLVAELVISRSRLWRVWEHHRVPELREALEHHDRLLSTLRDTVIQTRMVPVGQLFNRFPRMVRDLLHEQGKEADFVVKGSDIELDRTILEHMADPIAHLLRNAVDHGIEPPAEREQAGKQRRGRIRLQARRERESIVIEVSDDGRGLDREHILQTALRQGLITAEEAEHLTDTQVFLLICHPGFSTASQVTEVSGRGVGMDAVYRTVESLHGSLHITSRPGEGSTFALRLPLTLAIIQALLVKIGPERYAIPLSQVELAVEVHFDQTTPVISHRWLHDKEGQTFPLLDLGHLLAVPQEEPPPPRRYAVVVGKDSRRVGLLVDALLGRQEIVIRPLPPLLAHLPGLAGASILGAGEVILILDALHFVG